MSNGRFEKGVFFIAIVLLIALSWFWGSRGELNDRERFDAEPTTYEPVIRHHLTDGTTEAYIQVGLATTTHETTAEAFVAETHSETPVFDEISQNSTFESAEETTTPEYTPDWEITLLVYQVWGEIAIVDNCADYYGAKLQAAVVLNRINAGWGSSIADVIYQPGQFETWWYEQLMREGNAPNEACWNAVYEVLAYNDTPPGLIYADSRSTIPDGCYLVYESPTGQRFYCLN